MTKLKLLNAKEMEKLLFRLGFRKIRQKGSHVFYRHSDGRFTTLPHHGKRILSRPLMREVLREIDLTIEEYNDLLK